MIRDLATYPCQDACGELPTGDAVDGAPVYFCPGCDSSWYDDRECTPGAWAAAPREAVTGPDPVSRPGVAAAGEDGH